LFVERKSVTALHYRDLEIAQQDVRFIESERVPSDASIVGETWRFVNKNGGPDRCFNNNRQLPVCLYSELDFHSAGGLHGRLHLSRPDAGAMLVRVVSTLGQHLDAETSLKPVESYRLPRIWPLLLLVCLSFGYFGGLIAVLLLSSARLPTSSAISSFPQSSVSSVPAPSTTSVSIPAPRAETPALPVVKPIQKSQTRPPTISPDPHAPLSIIPPDVDADARPAVPMPHLRP
jgi:hypothetical protein